ncbi:RELT-like protein 2 isoform X1 [Scophthalmus maximus]|nr:RELT-like protein 2 isoform X1 [Scophthalmus maximus]XP_035506613.1 RELT-like protein 2 isoform X1 [Scophthalmus maximus]XP_035506615.1 RELT-like protein 2 isoform X1 [Scophthalmus maximus]XP_035506616.1 RELT-like protein 2 isoform X1 [Scophthalmus maximus]XP_035506617.1 RELT-like protein 2 isoform X1 [Scophthalmus maximus]XP_035506618.1 RELT-like protein 2 isoform X1 [Scophthalmus maximus]XP_035506619.1 RELT-like protein 2 isoform X1 [Scophthalmus maximus]XP_035506620.1 RELT-like protein
MTELEASGVGEHTPPYMIFLVVFLFFITGLLGFLVCHLLKKKGYRCRTGDIDDAEEEEEKVGGNADDEDEENQDTVEQILKCIIENEANMEAFNEMLGNHNICVRHDPRLHKESIGGVPPHHHTVHSGTDHNSCHLCAQVRSKKGRRQSRTPRFKQRPGEQTVFSVGRFRVIHTDKKLHGGPNPLVSSGDQLDQSQDSEEQKEGVYNLRSMFKDVRPLSERTNGVVPNVGKRRKSVTIFGLRRGSDPVGIKGVEWAGREAGGVKSASQKPPVVLEELVQVDNVEMSPKCDNRPGSTPEAEVTHYQMPSSQSKKQPCDSSSAPEPCTNPMINPFVGSTEKSPPITLLISSPNLSRQTFMTTEKQGHVADSASKNEGDYDPGPLQTSTPIVSITGSIPSFTPVIPTDHSKSCSSTVFPVIQTPPDPNFSPNMEAGFGAGLALTSLGSSPQSSSQIKTPSSISLLKTPTSPQAVMSRPALNSRNTPPEVTKTPFPPVLTQSPKLLSCQGMSSQSSVESNPLEAQTLSPPLSGSPALDTIPVSLQTYSPTADEKLSLRSSPHLTLKSRSIMSVTSTTKEDMVSSPLSIEDQDQAVAGVAKTEVKKVGTLKTAELLPFEGDLKGSALSCSSDHLCKDRLTSLPLSPLSPLSPSSSVVSRISSVAIVKASPDSKREFSVVTMLENKELSTLIKDQKEENYELGAELEKVDISSAVGQGETGQPESQRGKTGPMLSQEKDDMMEMEDIRDCKVQEAKRVEKMAHSQLKQD